MKTYEQPNIKVIRIAEDVIRTSGMTQTATDAINYYIGWFN